MSSANTLPPFSTLLKSREVEDPVNLYVHRPLAYAFVAAVFRTTVTPNIVTFLAMIVGITGGVCWIIGTRHWMVVGGAMVWLSAILDGADGILARAKNMQSQFGRALDGASDAAVAITTVLPAFYHIWVKEHQVLHMVLAVPTISFALGHIYIYDFYKESYLRMTRPGRGGEGEDVADVAARVAALDSTNSNFISRFAMRHVLLPFLKAQANFVRWTNPQAQTKGLRIASQANVADIYRKHNTGPMKLWAIISLAPHSYLMAICGMFDRLDVYMWIRLVFMNVMFFIVVVWQRRATEKTIQDFARLNPN